ncbi:Putative transmembrane protein (plasmid) [Deinococcus gobiensis I-0]|uniref:Putative transmembrane protein n=2 Tax=Deinococcus TaxID=1298 RepID=H8H087_DEIGI|nr:Putative transmembrane protein [Deinococcus gobiensis I-0]
MIFYSKISNEKLLIYTIAIIISALILSGLGGLLNIIYPVAMVVLGIYFISNNAIKYITLIYMLWFFSPLIRRLSDYQAGFHDVSLIIVTPHIVTIMSILPILFKGVKIKRLEGLAISVITVSILCGYLVGIFESGIFSATFSLLDWLCPLSLMVFIFLKRKTLELDYKAMLKPISLSVVFMGLYGIIQFVNILPWDAYWMRNADINSIGYPSPYNVRVFSTLNSPGPFAIVITSGILLLSNVSLKKSRKVIGLVFGGLSLLLSLVRSAWGGWFLGQLVILLRSNIIKSSKMILTFFIGILLIIPFIYTSRLYNSIEMRLSTFGNIQEDKSFNDRREFLNNILSGENLTAFGHGLGSTGLSARLNSSNRNAILDFDNGFLSIFYTLGIIPGILYCIGVAILLLNLYILSKTATIISLQAIAISIISQMIFVNTLIGVSGIIFWSSLGFAAIIAKKSKYE